MLKIEEKKEKQQQQEQQKLQNGYKSLRQYSSAHD